MKVHVEGNIFIESDERQYILKEYTGKTTTDKHGKTHELYRVHGYFGKLEQVMKKLVKMKILNSKAETIGELLEEVKKIDRYIEEKISH